MKIKDIGGEFALISRITRKIKDPGVLKGIGDDCAVLKYTEDRHLLITTDMMVENDHFSCKWYSPFQIGRKLMEVNVSDIVSMGGIPKYAFISLSIKNDTEVEFMDGLYEGLYSSADKHNVLVLGGDTTHGTEYVLNLTLLGEVGKDFIKYRSGAKEGDLICVTGKLGGSTAGLKLLLHGKEGYIKDHLEPHSRKVSEGMIIARYANSMIDVSDGLGSEVTHICDESGSGARIDFEKIPLSVNTVESGKLLGMDPYDFALYGGEDYELVFTIPPGKVNQLKSEFSDFTITGEILKKEEGIYLNKNGTREALKKGYDHFA